MLPRAAAILFLAAGMSLRADPGHEVTIAELTEQLQREPANADVLFQRGWNFRENNQPQEARADFEHSLRVRSPYLPASREIALLDIAAGKHAEAVQRLREALEKAPEDQQIAVPGACAILSRALLTSGQAESALQAARRGLESAARQTPPSFPQDLCMLRAEAQCRLGRLTERLAELRTAAKEVGSILLENAAIDAAIDAGQGAEVLAQIEAELPKLRWRGSWLIRRARALLQKGDDASRAATAVDLEAALTEISSRIQPERPELSLICDRGVVLFLQGKKEAAMADLTEAKTRGAAPWMLQTLTFLLEPPPQPVQAPAKSP